MFPRRYSTFAPCLRFCGGPLLWAAEGCFRSFPFSEDGPFVPKSSCVKYTLLRNYITLRYMSLLRGCGVTSSFHRPKEFDRYKYRPAFVWARSLLAKHSMLHRFASTAGMKNGERRRRGGSLESRERRRKFAARNFRRHRRRRRTGSERFRAGVDVIRTSRRCAWSLLCVNPV